MAARIVRVVNAYEEKVRDAGPGGPLTALEELRLGTGGEYAPEVVEALARVLGDQGCGAQRLGQAGGGRRPGLSDPAQGWVTHG